MTSFAGADIPGTPGLSLADHGDENLTDQDRATLERGVPGGGGQSPRFVPSSCRLTTTPTTTVDDWSPDSSPALVVPSCRPKRRSEPKVRHAPTADCHCRLPTPTFPSRAEGALECGGRVPGAPRARDGDTAFAAPDAVCSPANRKRRRRASPSAAALHIASPSRQRRSRPRRSVRTPRRAHLTSGGLCPKGLAAAIVACAHGHAPAHERPTETILLAPTRWSSRQR